ncbi:MAG: response regulator [Flavitalea sp.]
MENLQYGEEFIAISKILIVDDDSDDWEIITEALGMIRSDFSLAYVSNGKEAYELLAKANYQPDLILLDLNMPLINGYEFLNIRMRLPEIAKIPVIIHSTSNAKHISDHLQTLGIKEFVLKQPSLNGMVNSLASAIKNLFD